MESTKHVGPFNIAVGHITTAVDELIGSGLDIGPADSVTSAVINMLQACIETLQDCHCGGSNHGPHKVAYFYFGSWLCQTCAVEQAQYWQQQPQRRKEDPLWGPCQGKCGENAHLTVWAPQIDNPDFGATEDLLLCKDCLTEVS